MNFEGIYNYYERLVYDEVVKTLNLTKNHPSTGDAEDIACLALNKLPARYIRHGVDAAFFLTVNEQHDMTTAVTDAVKSAFEQVEKNPGKESD